VDENTTGVVSTLGQTLTLMYKLVDEIAAALDDLVSHTGIDVPIPVDAASGVFAASDPRPALKAGLNR